MKKVKFLVAGLAILLALSPRLQAQRVLKAEPVFPAASPTPSGVPLRNGDMVEIRIANVPPEDVGQINAVYTVDESGMINMPFIGLVKAAGYPPSQVETAIQNSYKEAGIYTDPTVSVNPPAGGRFVTVSGAVRAPGRVVYSSDLTLMGAIDAAAGPSDFASNTIKLIHNGKVIKYNRKRLDKDPSKDPLISPGDRIDVVESWY